MIKFHKIFFLLFLVVCSNNAFAKKKLLKAVLAPRMQTSLVVDANSGEILHNVNSHQKVYPASLTKLMTLYMTFDAVKKNKLKLNDQLHVSPNAERMLPGKLGLRAGEKITTKDAILASIVKSANDATVVLAEAISGTEEKFAAAMTNKAHQLGMKNTTFSNSSGWHHPNQKTTATDLAKLTLAIKRDFPQFYQLFKNDSFVFRGKTIMGHNRVTRNYAGAEGMKTGYTNPAGFNLVTTASKNGKSLIAVVTGSPSASTRDQKMIKLLDSHFDEPLGRPNVFAQLDTTPKKVTKPITKKAIVAKAKSQPKKYASSKKMNKLAPKNHALRKAA